MDNNNSFNRKRKHDSDNNNCDEIVEQIFNDAALIAKQQQQQLGDITNKVNKRAKIVKLDQEMHQQSIVEFVCQYCNLIFNSKAKLIMHEYKYHCNGSSTECPICCKIYSLNLIFENS